MIEIKTNIGFETKVDERILKDKRLIDALVKAQKGSDYEKLEATNAIAELLIGQEDAKRLSDIIASKNDGFVPFDVYINCIAEIMNSVKEIKN